MRPPGPPRGLCPQDEELYGCDTPIVELVHDECRIAAQQHDDQLEAWALDPRRHGLPGT